MHKFFSNRKLVIVIVCLVVSLGLITLSVEARNKRSTPLAVQQFGNDVVGFVDRAVTVPTNGIYHGVSSLDGLMNTYQENGKLKRQVNEVTSTQVRNRALQNENRDLKQQLRLGKSLTDYRAISASVVTRTPSAWQNQIIINKGRSSGVHAGMPVLVDKGLVGQITEVNQTNSKIELLTNDSGSANRFAIQIHSRSGKNVNGLITGYDRSTDRIEMSNVATKAKIKRGDLVSTNGLGGVVPKGLYVGRVTKIASADYGLSAKVYIKPAANLNDIEDVIVASKAK